MSRNILRATGKGSGSLESVRGIAFIKSRRAAENILKITEDMNRIACKNGVEIAYVYQDVSSDFDYDRPEISGFLDALSNEDIQVVVVRSLNEITDDMADLEEFVKKITNMGIWIYCLAIGPVPITISHAEDFGC